MTNTCQTCGRELPKDAPEGICPSCLAAAHFRSTLGRRKGPEPLSVDEVAAFFPDLDILGLLGAGGMGAVYKARQPNLDRLVALKILRGGPDPDFVDRFTREAKTLARLNHPNIVAVYDFGKRGRDDGHRPRRASEGREEVEDTEAADVSPLYGDGCPEDLFFLVMELVDGVTVRELLAQGRVEPEQALGIVPAICEALQYAHEKGVVHRDIKPENILIDKEGRVKVADFGIARLAGTLSIENLTGEGQVMGTANYMAPEQVERPGEVDHRADIYALGVVFYEMLTGELPLGKFPQPSKRVQIDVRLDEVVLKALEKEPERRYQQASEVGTSVQTIAAEPARQAPARPGTGSKANPRPIAIGAGVAAFLLVVAAGLFLLFRSGDESADLLAREEWPLRNEHRMEEAAGTAAAEGEDPLAEAKQAALAAATEWLELMDAGKYAEAWDESASVFRASIPRQQWEQMAVFSRQPLGGNLSRTVGHQAYTTSVPGAPDGEYVIIQFQSRFENKQQALETITPMLAQDGVWRVSGYFVQ